MLTAATRRTVLGLALCGCLLTSFLTGCGKDAPANPAQAPAMAVSGATPAAPAQAPAAAAAPAGPNQTFQDATVQDVPEDQRLPEETKTHKSVGKLYERVVGQWAKVPFTAPDSKKLAYFATITTDLGVIRIELW